MTECKTKIDYLVEKLERGEKLTRSEQAWIDREWTALKEFVKRLKKLKDQIEGLANE